MSLSKSLVTLAAVATIISVSGGAVFMFMQVRVDELQRNVDQLKDDKQELKKNEEQLGKQLTQQTKECDDLKKVIQEIRETRVHQPIKPGNLGKTPKKPEDSVTPPGTKQPAASPSDFTIRVYHTGTSAGRKRREDLFARLKAQGFPPVEKIYWPKEPNPGNKFFGDDLAIDFIPNKLRRVYYPSEAEPVLDVLKMLMPAGNRKYIERGKTTKQYELEGSRLDKIIDVIFPL